MWSAVFTKLWNAVPAFLPLSFSPFGVAEGRHERGENNGQKTKGSRKLITQHCNVKCYPHSMPCPRAAHYSGSIVCDLSSSCDCDRKSARTVQLLAQHTAASEETKSAFDVRYPSFEMNGMVDNTTLEQLFSRTSVFPVISGTFRLQFNNHSIDEIIFLLTKEMFIMKRE